MGAVIIEGADVCREDPPVEPVRLVQLCLHVRFFHGVACLLYPGDLQRLLGDRFLFRRQIEDAHHIEDVFAFRDHAAVQGEGIDGQL